jgi:hypothetical protein
VARISREAGADFGRVAAAHPAASWLLRWWQGRLSPEHLGCATPQQLLKLASGLGVELPAAPM